MRKKWLRRVLFPFICIILLIFLIWPYVFPGSRIFVGYEDVDIATGRIRSTQYLFWIRIWQSTRDSALTEVLPEEMVQGKEPQWRRVIIRCRGTNIHYVFHGAIAQINELKMIWSRILLTEEARVKTAQDVLTAWRQFENDSGAGVYIEKLFELLPDGVRQKQTLPITIDQLPSLEECLKSNFKLPDADG
ncbi:MAG: hypothetical protein JW828_14735 [Sedimentisphaerales bacterium]|nr:hypothetical protein [Sedimentisphaerales bacterium]